MAKPREIDMIHGPLGSRILQFALPLAVTGILQQLFNAADVAVVGRFVGDHAMAAVGSNTPVVGLFVNLFIGIALGANVVVAHCIGKQDAESVQKAAHTSVLFSLICGVALALIGQIIAAPLLSLLGVPENVFPMAVMYLRIYMAGMPVIILYNFEAALFRAEGDTRTPLIVLIIAGLVNVGLNLFFVLVMGMAAEGVALATVISNLVSAALLFVLLVRGTPQMRICFRQLRIDPFLLKRILQIGIPAGLQSIVFSISNMIIQSAINALGQSVMAASSAAFNVEIVVYYILNAFGQACTTFTGQNHGAGQWSRCRRVLKISLILDLIVTAAACALILLARMPLLSLFTENPEVIAIAEVRLFCILSANVVYTVIEVFSGSLRGYGYSMQPAVIVMIGTCGVRIFWVYVVFRVFPEFYILMMSYPVSWTVTAIAIVTAYLIMQRKFPKERTV